MLWLIPVCLVGILLILLIVCLVRAAAVRAKKPAACTLNFADLAERSGGYAERLSQMIAVETISSVPSGDYQKFLPFHDLIERLFPLLHKTCEKKFFDGSLLFKWKGHGDGKPILMMSHHDVVEAGGEWRYPPFSGTIADGKIWGRGTLDTKGSLFAILQAVEELIAEGIQPDGDVYIVTTCNEETDSVGAKAIVQYLKDQSIWLDLLLDEGGAVLDDPLGGVHGMFAMVGLLEKGYGDLKFTARGLGGHSSVQTKNYPLSRLAKFMVYVEKHDPFQAQFNQSIGEMFRRVAPYSDFGMRLIFANLWLFRPLLTKLLGAINPMAGSMIKTTIMFTRISGSDSNNVVANTASVVGNLRFSPHQDRDASIDIMRGIARRFDLETEVLQSNPACKEVPFQNAAFKLVEQAVNETMPGVIVTPYAMTGATDARFFAAVCDNLMRLSPILCTNSQLDTVHSFDENIDVQSLAPAVDFYKRIVVLRGAEAGRS